MYNTEKFVKAGDFREALLGNGALIVDRFNGQMYTTGSAYPIAFYIAEFRKGGSEFVRLHSPQEK